jgi:tetratricopeptide (TPR) repeat protein
VVALAIFMVVLKTSGSPGAQRVADSFDSGMKLLMTGLGILLAILFALLAVLWWLQRDPVLKEIAQLALEKRYDEAITRLQAHIQTKGENAKRLNALGLLFMESGRLDEALAQFRKAETFKDYRNDSINNQALVLHKMGRADEALALMKRVVETAPSDPVIACNYCTFLADAGREAEARDALERAERIIDRYDKRMLPETWKAAIAECRARLPRARGFPVEAPAQR